MKDTRARMIAAKALQDAKTNVADLIMNREQKDYLVSKRSRCLRQGADGNGSSFTGGGWNFAGAINRAVSLTNARRPGSPVMRISATAATTGRIYTKVPVTALTGKIEIWLYLPEPTAGASTLNIAYSSDTPSDPPSTTNPTNMRKVSLVSGNLVYGSWFPLTIMPSGKIYSQAVPLGIDWVQTGTPDAAEIEYLQIEYVPDANTPLDQRWFDIDLVAVNGKGRPMVMLGFDGVPDINPNIDGGAMLGKTRELFRRYGLRGYIAQDADKVSPIVDTNGVKVAHDQLYADGWDIITQGGAGHLDHTLLTETQCRQSMLDGRQALIDNGYIRALDWIMYPFNSRSNAVDAIASSVGFRAQREFRKPDFCVSSLGRQSLLRMGSYDAGGFSGGSGQAILKTSAIMIAWLDDCIAKGETFNMYTHIMKTTPTQSVDTAFAEYSVFLAYVADKYYAGEIDVVTPSEFLATVVNYPSIA